MQYCVITFHSVSEALNFEKVMKAEGLEIKLIPVPREISSSCGLAARFSPEDKDRVLAVATEKNLAMKKLYVLEEKPKKKNLYNLLG